MPGGVNFALFSQHADEVELCLFSPDGQTEVARLLMPKCSNQIWHGFVPGLSAGAVYGYRVYGPYDPHRGLRFNPNKLLLDPYAKALVGILSGTTPTTALPLASPPRISPTTIGTTPTG